jgi:hypothetical protein
MKRSPLVVGAILLLVLLISGAAMAADQIKQAVDVEEPGVVGDVVAESAPLYGEMFKTNDRLTLEKAASAEEVLLSYFNALFWACNLPEDNKVAISGTIGSLQEPYPDAYACWAKSWRDETSYEEFLKSWEGTVNVELLKLIPAGEEKGQKKYFVETRNMEAIQDSSNPRMGVFCYKGYITMANTKEGWRITSCQLEAEDPSWYIAGHQPWLAQPEEVAQVIGLGVAMGEDAGTRVVENNEDGSITVRFQDKNGKDTHQVILVQTQDDICQVISSQKID